MSLLDLVKEQGIVDMIETYQWGAEHKEMMVKLMPTILSGARERQNRLLRSSLSNSRAANAVAFAAANLVDADADDDTLDAFRVASAAHRAAHDEFMQCVTRRGQMELIFPNAGT